MDEKMAMKASGNRDVARAGWMERQTENLLKCITQGVPYGLV